MSTRQQRAVAAAQRLAARHGIHADRPSILQDSNHTVIHLAPAPIVAKVNTSPEETSLAGEVAVARFLIARGGEVVPPSSLLPPGPHCEDGLQITLWEYCPHVDAEPAPGTLGQALQRLHLVLAPYPEPLRPWDRFDGIERVLEDPTALAALPVDDRDFLRGLYRGLRAQIEEFTFSPRPLHGEPHAGNLLLSPHGPRWIDFESACLGPQEWDLTVLTDEFVARYFPAADVDLLHLLRPMRSLCVAVWCWHDPDRAPVLREAGTYHLTLLRETS